MHDKYFSGCGQETLRLIPLLAMPMAFKTTQDVNLYFTILKKQPV